MTQPKPQPNNTRLFATIILAVSLVVAIAIITYSLIANTREGTRQITPTLDPTTEGFAVTEGEAYTGTVYEPPIVLQEFTLPASTGETVSLSDFNDGWTLLFFGYTHCPDFCPTTLSEFRRIKRLMGDDAERVNFVFVSVDAARDTPEVLERYLSAFDPAFVGLSADVETLERIKADYGLYYALRTQDAPANHPDLYPVDHTTRTFVIDPDGRLRVSFAYNTTPEIIAAQLAALQNQ